MEIPATLQTFLMDIIEQCVKKGIRCCIDNFRCDDIHELFELSDSDESESSSDSEEDLKWAWRGEITFSKGEHVYKGTLKHYSYPYISMKWTNLSGKDEISLSNRNMVEFMDSFGSQPTSS